MDFVKKRDSFIRPLWKGSAAEYAQQKITNETTTWFQRQTEIAMIEQNNKVS